MKKMLSAVLSILCLVVFSSCGGGGSTPDPM
jgi:hypothetical protein